MGFIPTERIADYMHKIEFPVAIRGVDGKGIWREVGVEDFCYLVREGYIAAVGSKSRIRYFFFLSEPAIKAFKRRKVSREERNALLMRRTDQASRFVARETNPEGHRYGTLWKHLWHRCVAFVRDDRTRRAE